MHAYEIPGLRFSLPAAVTIARRRFVNVNSSSAAIYATAGGAAIGVSMDDAAAGNPVTISDGIVMVEAGGAITAGAQVQVGSNGVAVPKTSGVGIGVAITGASGVGQIVAIKLVSVSDIGADGTDGKSTQTLLYTSSDLAAGADLSDIPIGMVVGDGTIISAAVISTDAAAGIDDSNTSVFLLEVTTTAKAGYTFNTTKPFPAAGAAQALTIADGSVSAGDVLLLSVTNGATADLPIFMVQVVIELD